jgi:hypothetical protein
VVPANCRLSAVGAMGPLFIKPPEESSRTINTDSVAALLKAYHEKSQQVEQEHVPAVVQR